MPGPVTDQPRIFLGLPSYDSSRFNALAVASALQSVVAVEDKSYSLLTGCFNRIWCSMLNLRESHGVTHFIMMHADVKPVRADWVGDLYKELVACGGDILSAVIPIKTGQGLTSTGIDDTGDVWSPRRLTMHEVFEMPETFTHPQLVFNTGLWIADVRGDWPEQVCFHIEDRLIKEDGKWRAQAQPEDWHFSRQVRALGLKAFATRKIALDHHGAAQYTNTRPWGTLTTDVPDARQVAYTFPPYR